MEYRTITSNGGSHVRVTDNLGTKGRYAVYVTLPDQREGWLTTVEDEDFAVALADRLTLFLP